MQYGADYLSICTLWCMGLFLQCMLEKLLVSTGRSAFAMASQLIGALVNIALDPNLHLRSVRRAPHGKQPVLLWLP